jgi:hypothetical protein
VLGQWVATVDRGRWEIPHRTVGAAHKLKGNRHNSAHYMWAQGWVIVVG